VIVLDGSGDFSKLGVADVNKDGTTAQRNDAFQNFVEAEKVRNQLNRTHINN
jgi:hypothetical protein